jgi:hypothetical protein
MTDEGTAGRIAGRVAPAAAVLRATIARLVTDSGVPVQAAALALVAVAGELAESDAAAAGGDVEAGLGVLAEALRDAARRQARLRRVAEGPAPAEEA